MRIHAQATLARVRRVSKIEALIAKVAHATIVLLDGITLNVRVPTMTRNFGALTLARAMSLFFASATAKVGADRTDLAILVQNQRPPLCVHKLDDNVFGFVRRARVGRICRLDLPPRCRRLRLGRK
jgi:hypothetical protein